MTDQPALFDEPPDRVDVDTLIGYEAARRAIHGRATQLLEAGSVIDPQILLEWVSRDPWHQPDSEHGRRAAERAVSDVLRRLQADGWRQSFDGRTWPQKH